MVTKVQNTTGPDCFALKVDPDIGTICPPPADPTSPPYGVGAAAESGAAGGGTRVGRGARGGQAAVEYVRSQLDGSYVLF